MSYLRGKKMPTSDDALDKVDPETVPHLPSGVIFKTTKDADSKQSYSSDDFTVEQLSSGYYKIKIAGNEECYATFCFTEGGIYINLMGNSANIYHGGSALHEYLFRLSCQYSNMGGKVYLDASWGSILFHYMNGFRFRSKLAQSLIQPEEDQEDVRNKASTPIDRADIQSQIHSMVACYQCSKYPKYGATIHEDTPLEVILKAIISPDEHLFDGILTCVKTLKRRLPQSDLQFIFPGSKNLYLIGEDIERRKNELGITSVSIAPSSTPKLLHNQKQDINAWSRDAQVTEVVNHLSDYIDEELRDSLIKIRQELIASTQHNDIRLQQVILCREEEEKRREIQREEQSFDQEISKLAKAQFELAHNDAVLNKLNSLCRLYIIYLETKKPKIIGTAAWEEKYNLVKDLFNITNEKKTASVRIKKFSDFLDKKRSILDTHRDNIITRFFAAIWSAISNWNVTTKSSSHRFWKPPKSVELKESLDISIKSLHKK